MKLGTQSKSTETQHTRQAWRVPGFVLLQVAEAQIKKMQSHCPASQKADVKSFESIKHRIGTLRL